METALTQYTINAGKIGFATGPIIVQPYTRASIGMSPAGAPWTSGGGATIGIALQGSVSGSTWTTLGTLQASASPAIELFDIDIAAYPYCRFIVTGQEASVSVAATLYAYDLQLASS